VWQSGEFWQGTCLHARCFREICRALSWPAFWARQTFPSAL